MKFFLSKGLYGDRSRWAHGAEHMEPGHLFVWFRAWTLEVDYDPVAAGRWLKRLAPGGGGFWTAAVTTAAAVFMVPEMEVLAPIGASWAAYGFTVVKLKKE